MNKDSDQSAVPEQRERPCVPPHDSWEVDCGDGDQEIVHPKADAPADYPGATGIEDPAEEDNRQNTTSCAKQGTAKHRREKVRDRSDEHKAWRESQRKETPNQAAKRRKTVDPKIFAQE